MSVPVGILGATGLVGQRFIHLLSDHPYFRIARLGASARSAGRKYVEALSGGWLLSEVELPNEVAEMVVGPCETAWFKGVGVVFSALDAAVAGDLELAFKDAGFKVFTNAKNFRMHPQVPLVIPTANPSALHLLSNHHQDINNRKEGYIVANTNCSITGLCVVLSTLQRRFGPLSKLTVTTLQAISGSGYPGTPAIAVTGNVIPRVSGEEEKIETEPRKVLASALGAEGWYENQEDLVISANSSRVPVVDGHTVWVGVAFRAGAVGSGRVPQEVAEVEEALDGEEGIEVLTGRKLAEGAVPSWPKKRLLVFKGDGDRPQPRLDAGKGDGLTVSVGRIRKCPVLGGFKMVVVCHNTVIGAAGASVLNAELAVALGYT